MAYTPIFGESQLINGVLYNVQSAEKPHSIEVEGKKYRFAVYEGEAREGKDEGKERAELSQGEDKAVPYGVSNETSFAFRISASSTWVDIVSVNGQFHAGAGSPNLSMRIPSYNKMKFILRYGNSVNYSQKTLYSTSNFKPGVWYYIVIKAVFTPKTNGRIEIWINGSKKVNYTGITGYTDCSSTYFKFGIYRSTSAPDFQRVYFANVETGTTSLSSRITNPLPI